MCKQIKKRRLALLLFVEMIFSTVFGCWRGGDKFDAFAVSDKEIRAYFAEGLGTGADFSSDTWKMQTSFGEETAEDITGNPDNQAGIVENEHSGNQEKILRLMNARSLDPNTSDPADWSRVSTAMAGERFSLNETSEFSAKFTISMPDACVNGNLAGGSQSARESGGDGMAFIMSRASTVKGNINTGMGYYGLQDSLVVELDSYFNGAYCNFHSTGTDYVNWAYDNQIFANSGSGYLQAVSDDTRNKGTEYDWVSEGPGYWTYLNNYGYTPLSASQDRRFDHVGVMLDGETREHFGISYLNGIKPDYVENGRYVNIQDLSASAPSASSKCETRFADVGDLNVLGEEVDNRLFTIWVEYNGEDLFVRYANGSFSEAVRPEVPQIALEGRYELARKFANEDVSIGFVSSISDTGSAASHTVHSVAFANVYIENGITAEYIYNAKLTAAKEAVLGVLDGITMDNDTTKGDIQDLIANALDQAGIAEVAVTVAFTKTEPTTSDEGRIDAVISFECGTVTDSITISKIIEKLPAPIPTETPAATPPTAAPPIATPPAATLPTAPTETPAETPTDTPTAIPPTILPAFTPDMPPTGEQKVTPMPVAVSREKKEKNALYLNAKLKVSQTGKKISVRWGGVPGADGYDVYVQYCGKKFTKKSITPIKKAGTTKAAVKKVNGRALDLKRNYKIYVLAYKLADGRKVTLARTITAHVVGRNNKKYTNAKAVKAKKSSYILKQGRTAKISAGIVLVDKDKKQLTNAHAKKFRYAVTDKTVAAVSVNGKIKAVGKGVCTIYVYARNGFAKKLKVTVK